MAVPLLTQLPTKAPEKRVEDDASAGPSQTYVGNLDGVLGSSALAWPGPGYCSHSEMEPVDGGCLSLSVTLPCKQIKVLKNTSVDVLKFMEPNFITPNFITFSLSSPKNLLYKFTIEYIFISLGFDLRSHTATLHLS